MFQQQKNYLQNLQKYFRKRVKIMPKCAILIKLEQSRAEQSRTMLKFRQRTQKFNAHPFIYCREKNFINSRPILSGGVCA